MRPPDLIRAYRRYGDDRDACQFITEVAQRYSVAVLQRLATAGGREMRRAAVLGLSWLGDYDSHRVLGVALRDSDRRVRLLAECGIRQLWFRQGSDDHRLELLSLERLNRSSQYASVLCRTERLCADTPWLAELWYQRAVARLALGEYRRAVEDFRQALRRNRLHFEAAVDMGRAYLKLDAPLTTLHCWRGALQLNPNMDAVRAHVDKLYRTLNVR